MHLTVVSLVIPVCRNEGTLSITYNKVTNVFNNELNSYKPEFIFINDGSDDGSLNELLLLKKKDSSIKIISATFESLFATFLGRSQLFQYTQIQDRHV